MRNIDDQVEVEGTEDTVYEYFLSKGWTDGLPVIPPTIERVEAFLAQANVAVDDIIGIIPPQWVELTVEKLAVNAVMAGCKADWAESRYGSLGYRVEGERDHRSGNQTCAYQCGRGNSR